MEQNSRFTLLKNKEKKFIMEKIICLNCTEEQFKWLQEKDSEEMEELQNLVKKHLESLGMPSSSDDGKTKKVKNKTRAYKVKKFDQRSQQMLVQIAIRNALDTLLSIGVPMEHIQILFKEDILKRVYAMETVSYVICNDRMSSEEKLELTNKAFEIVLNTKLGIFKAFKSATDVDYFDFLDSQNIISDNMLDFFQCLSIMDSEEQIDALCEDLEASMMDNQANPSELLN